MGRPRNEDKGLTSLKLSRWRDSAACWAFGRRWVFGAWDPKVDKPTPAADAKFLRQLQLWSVSPSHRPRDSEPLFLELWADWLASAHAPKNPPGGIIGRIERELFGTPEQPGTYQSATVSEFGAPELLAWQTSLGELRDDRGNLRLGRATIYKYVAAVRQCFAWGVMAGRVDALQVAALSLVKPAPKGTVKESTKRRGVRRESVDSILPFLSPPVRAIIELMWATCARPEELCRLRVRDIARGGSIMTESAIELDIDSLGVWAAVLREHKTDDPESEFDRVIFFGPKSQSIIRAIIDDGRGEGDYLFRPADGRAAFIASQRAKRKPGGYGSYKKPKGEAAKRKPREAYTSQTIRESVIRACERAKVPIFTPYQIRHSVFKLTQARYGRDTARAFGGHRVGGATENYAGFDLTAAAKVARETG